MIVINNLFIVWFQFPEHIDACAHVTDTPDLNKIIVLSRGILKGLNGWMFRGGHIIPSSWFGDNLWWKNLQKKLMKNNTSDVINKIIPYFIEIITLLVWLPW